MAVWPSASSSSEERAIPAVAPRRRLPVQVRRLDGPEPKPAGRFLRPVVLATLMLGLAVYLVLLLLRPAPVEPAAVPVADVEPPVATVVATDAETEGVPLTQATPAPSEPTPDPQVVNEQK